MQFHIYRDLTSISFVRCTSPVPGAGYNAEGTAFSLQRALEKCRSEVIERTFHRQLPAAERARLMGIAAHPCLASARQHAWSECLENVFLERLASSQLPHGVKIPFWNGGCVLIARIDQKWISLFCFPHDGTHAVVQSVSSVLLVSLLKSWTELRNIKLYRPAGKDLPSYTKGNYILSGILPGLSARFGLKNNVVSSRDFSQAQQEIGRHFVTYFRKEEL